MLSFARHPYVEGSRWLVVFPSTAVFGINLLGDSLRDVLDPGLGWS